MLSGKDFAKPSSIAISRTHLPVASKLGLRPQTVSPLRQISSHEMTQSLPMFCSCLFHAAFLYFKLGFQNPARCFIHAAASA